MSFLKHLVFTSLVVCFFTLAYAQQNTADGIIFDSDNATFKGFDKKNQIIELDSHVQIIYQGQFIACDKASIDTKNTTMTCQGNVTMVSNEAKLQADKIVLNYKKNTGEITNGFVQVGQVLFEGETIKKVSEDRYETTSGQYTACTNCPAFWSFRGSKVDAEIGGYAYIRNATVYFGKVPALWFPYLIVPIKSERQTGLLFPGFQQSGASGFTYQQSFFWAMSDSTDSTITVKNYTRRGLKGLLNYRYVLSEESHGSFDFGYIKDRYFSQQDLEPQFNPSQSIFSRWFVNYKHHYEMPYGFVQMMDIHSVSDTRYPRDYPLEVSGHGDSNLESRISLVKNSDLFHWSVDTSYYQSLLLENPVGNNNDSVHRFPEVNLSMMPRPIWKNLLFQFDVNYLNLTRGNRSYDDLDASGSPVPPDGKYDPQTDLIRVGQRLDLQPSLSYPLYYGEAFHFVPSVTYRETNYQFPTGDDPSAYRRYLQFNATTGVHFSKIFGSTTDPLANRYKHVLLPEVNYSIIPWNRQKKHPFFGDSEFEPNYLKDQPISDFDNIQFDYRDRVFDRNLITYSLTNKVLRKRWVEGTSRYDQIIRYKAWQSYDLYEKRRTIASTQNRYPWSEISNLIETTFDNFEMNMLIKYYPYQNVSSNATRIKVYNDRRDYIQTTYSQDFLVSSNKQVNVNNKTRDITLGAGVNIRYIQLTGSVTYDLIHSSLQSYAFTTHIKPPGDCWALIYSQEQLMGSQPERRFNIGFLFDGKTESGLTKNGS